MKKIIFTVLLTALLTGCQFGQPEFKQYENQKYGISLQYPSNWYVHEQPGISGITISAEKNFNKLIKTTAGPRLTILGLNKKAEPGKEDQAVQEVALAIEKVTRDFNKEASVTLTKDNLTINGKAMLRLDSKNIKILPSEAPLDSTEYILGNGAIYFFAHNQKVFMIELSYAARDENKYYSILDQIIQSLNFN